MWDSDTDKLKFKGKGPSPFGIRIRFRLIVQRDGADHATSPLHGRLLERARSSSILHLQPSCASAHTQRNTQPHTTTLHCPPSYTALSPFTSHRSVGRRNARGERENARVQGTGEQDGKWGTGTPRDLESTLGPVTVISVGSGYPNPKILGLYLPTRVEFSALGTSKAPPPAGVAVAGPAPRSYSRSRCG